MILEDIKNDLPKDAMISDVSYEGSEIILYTKNKEFFTHSTDLIKKIVGKVKKRIEVRADPSIIAEKPGLVIGKSGETLLTIKEKTFWTPDIKRAPVIDSEIIRSIRKMLHKEAGYRKKFLNKLGEKIYTPGKEVEWIRVTALGAYREVGRSCSLLQTPNTKVLLDCGMSVAMTAAKPYPYLDAPEFNIQNLDAVILSHAHTDHCLPPHTKVRMADGSLKLIAEIKKDDEVLSMNFETGTIEKGICCGKTTTKGHKYVKQIRTPFRLIEASPNHRFFAVRNLDVVEVEAQDLREEELLPITAISDETNNSVSLDREVAYDSRRNDITTLPDALDTQLAFLIGYAQGDGHKSSENTIRITDSDISLLELYQKIVQEIFAYKPLVKHHPDKTKNAWILEINNAKIIRFLEKNFPNFLEKTLKRKVPQKMLESSEKVRTAYLRGLMDAEGSVSPKNNMIRFAAYSPELFNGVYKLLLETGIGCTLDRKNHTIRIGSLQNIRKFAEKIGFNSGQKTAKTAILTSKNSLLEKDIIPITATDLKRIISDARLFGRVHNSPKFRKNLTLYDWLTRKPSSYCTRRVAMSLAEMLETRVQELEQLATCFEENDLKTIRQSMSIPLSALAQETGMAIHTLASIELGYLDNMHKLLSTLLQEKLHNSIEITKGNIEKIRKIINLPLSWEQITEIKTAENPYDELIDIEVLPNRNFIAEDIVVHNCGVIPYLYEWGYRGPLYCTRPTRDLAVLLQLDYLQICQRENKKAIYSSKGVEEAVKHCVPLEYGEVTDIAPDMRLTFQNAGHLLGSATTHIHIGEGLHNVLYTGDMKYQRTKLFERTSTDYARCETLILEATYGTDGATMSTHREGEMELARQVKKVIERGGRVVVPSFAVGRGQDIIAIIAETDIEVPIYLDGMLWDATAIHTAYPEFMSRGIQNLILHKGNNPFIDPRLKGIGSQKEREKVFENNDPCVVIATSGMLNGGPVIEYLQRFASEEKNMLLFVGYQAEGTMGRRIQKGWKNVQLENGKTIELNLEIATVSGLGGHSEQNELLQFVNDLRARPKKILTNHGDNTACVDLARRIHKTFKIESMAPKNLETIRLR